MNPFLELRRQVVHLCLGLFFIIGLYFELFFWWSFFFLLFMAGITIILAVKLPLKRVLSMISFIDRKDAFFPGFGAFTFVFAFMLLTFLFPLSIALPSLIIMVVGDAVATIIGVYVGRYVLPWNKKKTWEGFIVGFLVATTASGFFLSLPVALLASFLALLVESIKWPHALLDDNVLMPLVVALLLLLLL